MKICYDNENRIVYKDGKWYLQRYKNKRKNGKSPYYYYELCKECGDEFIDQKKTNGQFCCRTCMFKNDKWKYLNSEAQKEYNKKEGVKEKRSKLMKIVMNQFHIKEKLSNASKKLWEDEEQRKKFIKLQKLGWIKFKNNWKGKNNPNWNGYRHENIPIFSTFSKKLNIINEDNRKDPNDNNILQVKCSYCKKWYTPNIGEIEHRYYRYDKDMSRFYCSKQCKQQCPIYGKSAAQLQKQLDIQNGIIQEELRQIHPYFRQLVLEHDNFTC
jgi:hypothetical protein